MKHSSAVMQNISTLEVVRLVDWNELFYNSIMRFLIRLQIEYSFSQRNHLGVGFAASYQRHKFQMATANTKKGWKNIRCGKCLPGVWEWQENEFV